MSPFLHELLPLVVATSMVAVPFVAVGAISWLRSKRRKPVVATYSCPHKEEVEFSGGYRDAVRTTLKQCGYKLKFTSTMSTAAGTWTAFCPIHNAKLTRNP